VTSRNGNRILKAGMQAAPAFVASVAFFVLASAVTVAAHPHIPVIVVGAAHGLAVLTAAQFWGVAYAVPATTASMIAIDWFALPPTHPLAVPDFDNLAFVTIWLAVAVIVGQIAAGAIRRAAASEAARSVLADEQAALRRVATIVAHQPPLAEILGAVVDEARQQLRADAVALIRNEPDGSAATVATSNRRSLAAALDTFSARNGESLIEVVRRTAQPARIDDRDIPDAAAATPIVVEDRLWGVMIATFHEELPPLAVPAIVERRQSRVPRHPEQLPMDTEARIQNFADLAATAISNAETRAELNASRARVVAAADETRRRLERDLHDGIQQRLVSIALDLRGAERMAHDGAVDLPVQLSTIGEGLAGALEGVRELARGIHPVILSEGGLAPALRVVARRSPVPVRLSLDITARLPERIEVAAYYVASEALTNVAKHARASVVDLRVALAGDSVSISIRDDGIGGADPARGSGLTGLADRVKALGGMISVTSPVGEGTALEVSLPFHMSP
jgi:signal transduction histidine kinase